MEYDEEEEEEEEKRRKRKRISHSADSSNLPQESAFLISLLFKYSTNRSFRVDILSYSWSARWVKKRKHNTAGHSMRG